MKKFFGWVLLTAAWYVGANALGYSIDNLSTFWWAAVFIFFPLILLPLLLLGWANGAPWLPRDPLVELLDGNGFHVSDMDKVHGVVLLIDTVHRKLCVAYGKGTTFKTHIYTESKVLGCDIEEDASQYAETEGTIKAWRPRFGRLHHREGGLFGRTESTTVDRVTVRRVELRILVDDAQPSHRVVFFTSWFGADGQSFRVTRAREAAQRWQIIIELLMSGTPIPETRSLEELRDYRDAAARKGFRGQPLARA